MPASEAVAGMTRPEPMDARSVKKARRRQNAKSSSLKLGKSVKLGDRMCWVREPNVTIDDDSIQWWPGIEYMSFKELIADSYDLKFRINILKLIKKYPDQRNARVIVGFKGNSYFYRTIQSDAHREGRVAEYWDNVDKYDCECDSYLKGFKMLQTAQEIYLSKVEPADDSDEGSPMHVDGHNEISPVSSNEGGDVEMREDGIPANITVQARTIEDDFGNKCSPPKMTESAQVIETISTNKNTEKPETQTAVSPIENETEENAADIGIEPYMKWKEVFRKLKKAGWKYITNPKFGEFDYVFIKPNRKHPNKGGKVNEDYYEVNIMGWSDKIEEYVKEQYNWLGEEAEYSNAPSPESSVPENDEKIVDDEKFGAGREDGDEDELIDDNSAKDEKEDVFEFEESDQKKPSSYWAPTFFKAGLKKIFGEKTQDGGKQSSTKLTQSKRKGDGILSTQSSKKQKKIKKQNSAEKSKTKKAPKGEWGKKSTSKKKAKKTNIETIKVTSPPSPAKPQLSWLDLKNVEGWYHSRAPTSKYPLLDWLYIRPGFTKMDTLGEHCFSSEEDAVKYALDHPEILQTLKPYAISSPVTSEASCVVPSSQPSVEEHENISSPSYRDEDDSLETESPDVEDPTSASPLSSASTDSSVMSQLLWIDLKSAEGWTYTNAPTSDLVTSYYYVRPGCSVKGIENVDWFKSEEAAVSYALKHPECLQNLKVSAIEPDSPESQQSFEFFGVENANSWWQLDKVPKFTTIWKSLRKIGVKHTSRGYQIPNGDCFESAEDLQKYLCKHGLPANASTELSNDELSDLMRYISLSHIPKRVSNASLYNGNGNVALMNLPGGASFSDADAWKILCRFCQAEKRDSFFMPFEETKSFNSIAEIRQYIRANGIQMQESWSDEAEELIVCVLLWASTLPVPVEEAVNQDCDNEEIKAIEVAGSNDLDISQVAVAMALTTAEKDIVSEKDDVEQNTEPDHHLATMEETVLEGKDAVDSSTNAGDYSSQDVRVDENIQNKVNFSLEPEVHANSSQEGSLVEYQLKASNSLQANEIKECHSTHNDRLMEDVNQENNGSPLNESILSDLDKDLDSPSSSVNSILERLGDEATIGVIDGRLDCSPKKNTRIAQGPREDIKRRLDSRFEQASVLETLMNPDVQNERNVQENTQSPDSFYSANEAEEHRGTEENVDFSNDLNLSANYDIESDQFRDYGSDEDESMCDDNNPMTQAEGFDATFDFDE
ncbi:predicted protein [Chaetoceros tenuissimus]|uniref:Uncharacterized protein n=1 Tax=Chaetoceros tenuissimus TaxID=426638 RepID=A0AAD3CV11_9STRA|nr:predicted protein [Chaetoceros tenuissimus]